MKKCPVCGSSVNKQNICKISFTFNTVLDLLKCTCCELMYCDPLPTKEQFTDFYSVGGDVYNRWRDESKADAYIKQLVSKQQRGRFLDVGCATGCFIKRIESRSEWSVFGVELNKATARFATEAMGLKNVYHGELLDAAYDSSFFDCIHVGDVLEHVPNPAEFLMECRRILKPDGFLYLIIPNGYSDSRGLIKYYTAYKEPGCHASGHVFYFSKKALNVLFNKVGFKIDAAYTSGIKQGLRNLGVLPNRRQWAKFYEPRRQPEVPLETKIELIKDKKYPDFYYKYRYARRNLMTVRGLHNFGLNFKLILSPIC